MRHPLIVANLLAPALALALEWNGAWAWGVAALAIVHAATLWATLWPYCQWWGPQQTDFVPAGREVWLTLDDGPDAEDTPATLASLEAHGAKATFFLIAAKAAARPDLVREIIKAGHSIGSHTLNHRQYSFWRLGPRALSHEIDGAAAIFQAILGTSPLDFRAPAGMRNAFLHPVLQRRRLRLISWTVRGLDGRDTNRQRIINRIVAGARPGAILLLHEGKRDQHGRSLARDCVPAVLSALTERGYRFVIPDSPR